ncbi:glycosyl hydrolase family 95 catalytic domain-containing protein [uncultured Streptomyces sp.]|uniref:glycosyl hydrolase family 95 catalytic domain-containing protein n=1 Tax=uncultured Streptomyces sp. TaxID=174707 RepID=UPI0026268029|nr:glycoside hydrolase N-terminal domain-containing protein [uncultured Streptomyces sp.]
MNGGRPGGGGGGRGAFGNAGGTWEPRPAARWEDAFLSGNGSHGAMVYGDPADDRVVVTHHTLVRPNGSEHARPPELADELGALQDALLAGDTAAAERFGAAYPMLWVQPFHPAFQTRLRGGPPEPGGDDVAVRDQGSGYRRWVEFGSGQAGAARGAWRSRVFVSRPDDVIVQHVTAPGPVAQFVLDHALPGAPADLAVTRSTELTPDGALLTLRVGYPGSTASYTGTTRLRAETGTVTVSGDGVRVTGAASLLLLTRVRRDADDAGATRPVTLPEGDYESLMARHLPPQRAAFERVALRLPDAEDSLGALPGSELLRRPSSPALLERLFAAGRYHLLSSSGLLPPRLPGIWTGEWDTAWSGAFTTNANLNLQVACAPAAGLTEVMEAHARLIMGQLADWRDNARALFGARGIVAPSHTDGAGGHTRHFQRAYPLHLWTAGADWLLAPLLEQADTTGEFPSELISALDETALFYEDFLTRSTPDGTLVIVPSYSPENRPENASWGTLNAAMDITAARHALTTAAALRPGTSTARRRRALADRLPSHRVNEDGALAEWAWPGLRDTYDHRHLSHLYAVWPLTEINPYDTPELAEAAHRALALRGPENGSAHGHLHHGLIAARLRDGVRASAALASVLGGDYFHDSLMSAHYPGRDVYNADAAHALPALVLESLVQSAPDRLVLLPTAAAPLHPYGELTGVRTRFGARVDLTWSPDGATAVLRPDRDARIDVRTGPGLTVHEAGGAEPAGPQAPAPAPPTPDSAGRPQEPLVLTAGVDRVLTLRPR